MKASTPQQALAEGRKCATLLAHLFQKNPDLQFEHVSDFAQYFAIDVLGYRDAEIANSWTRGFVSALMQTPTPEELNDQYALGNISLNDFQRLIQKAIKAPPSEE